VLSKDTRAAALFPDAAAPRTIPDPRKPLLVKVAAIDAARVMNGGEEATVHRFSSTSTVVLSAAAIAPILVTPAAAKKPPKPRRRRPPGART
jgi:hypothetical protein